MAVRRIGVVGGGLMGSGIAQVAAQAGFEVTVVEVRDELVQRSLDRIRSFLSRDVEKGRISSAHREEIMGRIRGTTALSEALQGELVIEAIPENLEQKQELFRRMDEQAAAQTVLASNTSSLSITEIASATRSPWRVVGMHFFYPVPKMPLVEIIPGLATREDVVSTVWQVAEAMGKQPVRCPDTPGFLVNRLLVPMMNEAIYCVMEGVDPRDVDKAMKLGANMPMGPIELADFVGLDTLLFALEGIYHGFGDPKYRPCPLLKRMVQAGRLGRKTGRGFYEYT